LLGGDSSRARQRLVEQPSVLSVPASVLAGAFDERREFPLPLQQCALGVFVSHTMHTVASCTLIYAAAAAAHRLSPRMPAECTTTRRPSRSSGILILRLPSASCPRRNSAAPFYTIFWCFLGRGWLRWVHAPVLPLGGSAKQVRRDPLSQLAVELVPILLIAAEPLWKVSWRLTLLATCPRHAENGQNYSRNRIFARPAATR
jgi:hypothetical protein